MTAHRRRDGLGWAYAGVALGGAVSVAANVAHSFVPPAGAAAGWRPMHGAVLGAVFWPVALFVAIEILARTTWPAGTSWRLVRLGGLLPVALVAAVVSYRHLSGLIRYYGEDGLTATFGPLAVDGLMAVASAALLAASSQPADAREATPEPEPASVGLVVVHGATPEPEPAPVASVATSEATPEPGSAPVTSAAMAKAALESGAATAPDSGGPAAGDVDGADRGRPQLEDARAFVRTELAAGRMPSGAAVGRRYGRNSRWGQRVVRDVLSSQQPPTSSAADDLTPVPAEH